MIDPIAFWSVHTFRVMVVGTALIGGVSAALGTFAYLRRQSLVGDVVSHSALPGVMAAFVIGAGVLGIDGRNMVGLVVGAFVAGTLAVLFVNLVARTSVTSVDVAMAVALALFFGGGMVTLRLVQASPLPGKGGLADYLFGNASVLTTDDVRAIAVFGAIALAVLLAFWGPLTCSTFDAVAAEVAGFNARRVDLLLFGAITLAIVVGLKAVGLILMVAFVITPPAAARQWVTSVGSMTILSGAFGAGSAAVGSYLSVALGRVPTGPVIVLVMTAVFVVSLFCSPNRSVLRRAARLRRRRRELLAQAGVNR